MSSPYRPPQHPQTLHKKRTGMAMTSLVIGLLGLPCGGLLGLGATIGLVLGIIALVKANKEPDVYGGTGIAIGGIVTSSLGLLLLPIIAAIAIPSFMRARVSKGVDRALGDIRTVISAEMTYASNNGNYFDTIECLVTPTDCIPDYPTQAPVFLNPEFLSTTRGGYDFFLHPGPSAGHNESFSPSSMRSFAYVAVPSQPGVTAVRAFCGDSSGTVCAMADGTMPEIVDGRCPESCPALN